MGEQCGNCRFVGTTAYGCGTVCRRHAPITDGKEELDTPHWPWVYPHFWCGDYEPVRQPKPEEIAD
jgi:hypothetical protein